VTVLAGTGVTLVDTVNARSANGMGGSLLIGSTSGGLALSNLRNDGDNGGTTVVAGLGAITINRVVARGEASGGMVTIGSAASITLRSVQADSDGTGGMVEILSGGSLEVISQIDVAGMLGGKATLTASGDLLVGLAEISAEEGGEVRLSGASIPGIANVSVDSDAAGGLFLATSTSGDIGMDSIYDARGTPGGIIQVEAAGDLFASGQFKAVVGGCIGLSAGGTVNTTGGIFDVPITPTCGASPSGAFLDGALVF
jgi:hypothetical protein